MERNKLELSGPGLPAAWPAPATKGLNLDVISASDTLSLLIEDLSSEVVVLPLTGEQDMESEQLV